MAQSAGLMTSKDGGASWSYQGAPAGILGIAVDAEDPSALYILCGEYNPWVGALMEGSTLYRSPDAGGTWHEIEFEHVGYVEWIAADPRVPGVLYAASLSDKDGDKVFRTEAHLYRSRDEGDAWEGISGEWMLDRTKFSPQVQMWCKWSFAADLEADQASGIAFYALKHMGTDELPVYNLYKWVPGN